MTARNVVDYLIIGGGVLGLFTAFYLARLGERIQLLEARCIGAGASGHSGALIRSNCATEVETELAERSLTVFRNWSHVVGGQCRFVPAGVMELVGPTDEMDLEHRIHQQNAWGADVERLTPAEAARLAPLIRTHDVAAVGFQASAGYCDPISALQTLHRAVVAAGVECRVGEPVVGFELEGSRGRAIRTANDVVQAGAIVIAAGAQANGLLKELGLDLALVPHLSRLAVLRPCDAAYPPHFPTVLDAVQDSWFRPFEGGLLVGASVGGQTGADPEPRQHGVPPGLAQTYGDIAARRFIQTRFAPCRGIWQSTYMLSPDKLPLVG